MLEAFRVEGELSDLTAEALAEAIEQAGERLDAFLALEDPSDEDVANAEATAEVLASLHAENDTREQAAASRVERMAALRSQREPEPEGDEGEDEPDDGTEDLSEEEQAEEREAEAVTASTRPARRRRAPRPDVPETPAARMTIIAAADVPNVATGSEMPGLADVAKAWLAKSKALPRPNGRGEMHRYPIASLVPEFPQELIASGANDQEVFFRAANESRLEGGSLTAAAGWCAPSETLYNVPGVDASTDGLVDVPEIQVSRGGFRYTEGVDFSTLYANSGDTMTEAQAIAGTTKTCYEIPCVDFTEVRLDASYLCVKVPILLESGYPEVVRETMSGLLIAQQHRESADMIARMVAKADAAIAVPDTGSVAASSLDAVELVVQTLRSDYRLPQNATMEVLAPFWLKSAIRADYAMRTGVDLTNVTDQMIEAHFATRGARIQWLYNWQNLVDGEEGYPASATLMVYPAGTFVKGVADVISLDAIYDAASLANNIYTGMFAERGILLAKMAKKAKQLTIPVKATGITGAANSTVSFNLTP